MIARRAALYERSGGGRLRFTGWAPLQWATTGFDAILAEALPERCAISSVIVRKSDGARFTVTDQVADTLLAVREA